MNMKVAYREGPKRIQVHMYCPSVGYETMGGLLCQELSILEKVCIFLWVLLHNSLLEFSPNLVSCTTIFGPTIRALILGPIHSLKCLLASLRDEDSKVHGDSGTESPHQALSSFITTKCPNRHHCGYKNCSFRYYDFYMCP